MSKNLNKISSLLTEIDKLCKEDDLGDIFSYSKVKEVLTANLLGHTVPKDYSGADGYKPDGTPVEYKSTIAKKIQATYNGISVQETWDKQVEYLEDDKIGKYPSHYMVRFDGTEIMECYELQAADVLSILLPKLKKQFHNKSIRKDPRLGATISSKDIIRYGKLCKPSNVLHTVTI